MGLVGDAQDCILRGDRAGVGFSAGKTAVFGRSKREEYANSLKKDDKLKCALKLEIT